MNEKVLCPFCRFFGEPEKTKVSKKKPIFQVTCSCCGNVIHENKYIPKPKAERSANHG